MEPVFLKPQLAAAAICRQTPQIGTFSKALRKIRVQLSQHFPAPSLRTQHERNRDELAGYSTISN